MSLLYKQSKRPNLSYKLDNNFDKESNCKIVGSNNKTDEKKCCGDYPLRFPYRPNNGERGCCVDRTYPSSLMSCCVDGSVKFSCL